MFTQTMFLPTGGGVAGFAASAAGLAWGLRESWPEQSPAERLFWQVLPYLPSPGGVWLPVSE